MLRKTSPSLLFLIPKVATPLRSYGRHKTGFRDTNKSLKIPSINLGLDYLKIFWKGTKEDVKV